MDQIGTSSARILYRL